MKIIIGLALAMTLAACAGYSGRGLTPGQSSVDEVEALMGPASDRRPGADGETVRYYSRLPYGGVMYAARFGPDGKLRAIEQRLTDQYVAKLVPGRARSEEVRDLLGPPWRIDHYQRLMRDIWTYPVHASPMKMLFVQFSADGVAREIYLMNDPEFSARDSAD